MLNDSWTKSVHHDGSPYYVVGKALQTDATLTLRLRADVEASIERVFLRTTPNGEQRMQEMCLAQVEEVTCWWEIDLKLHMPRTNYRFFLQSSEGGYWLKPPFRIDGWRIDVANMLGRQNEIQLGHKVGRGMRSAVKAEKSDAYLIGEHFYDGTAHLQGDELDATMNYQDFMFPVLQWLTDFNVHEVWRRNWLKTNSPLSRCALLLCPMARICTNY